MYIRNINNIDYIKVNDTATQIQLKIFDNLNNPFDLKSAMQVFVVIGNHTGRILTKIPDLLDDTGVLEFGLDNGDLLEVGHNLLEVHIIMPNGEKFVAPSKGYYKLSVFRSIDSLGEEVTTVTLDYFLEEVNRALDQVNTKAEYVNQTAEDLHLESKRALNEMNTKVEYVNQTVNDLQQEANQALEEMNTKVVYVNQTANDLRLESNQALEEMNTKVEHVNQTVNDLQQEANQALEEMNTKVEYVNQTAEELRQEVGEDLNSLEGYVNQTADVLRQEMATAIQYVDDTTEDLRQDVSDDLNSLEESVNQTANDLRQEVATAIQYVDDTVEDLRQEVGENLDSLVTQEVENKMTPLMEVINEHLADDVLKGEVHGLRVFNGKLEYFDGQEWQRAKLDEQRVYGVRIDKNNTNPETRVTYIGDAVGFTPMRGNDGDFQWGSWRKVFESFEIRPCVLKNEEVQYYLDPNDFTKKIDGSPANLTGADGDVMVEFGRPLWWKWTDEGDTYTIEISNKEFDGAVKHAFEIEEGYNLVPYYALLLTQILFVIFFKSTDSQTAIGRGYVDGNSTFAATGGTNAKGMFYGESTGKQQMKFLGIEDYWGNKYWRVDGLASDDNHNLLIGKGNFNDNGSGYQTFASGVSSDTAGYIDSVQGGNDKGFIIKSGSGSVTTYYADYGTLYSSRAAIFGGNRAGGSSAGAFYLRLNNPGTYANENFGARLFCSVGDKIYIGAYLGTTQNEKLSSISGASEPTGNKTIGAFRTEARANN